MTQSNQSESQKIRDAWKRYEAWGKRYPEIDEEIELGPPGEKAEIEQLELKLGIPLPDSFKESLLLHNGMSRLVSPYWVFMDTDNIESIYAMWEFWNNEAVCYGHVDNDDLQAWAAEVLEQQTSIKGPVKPLLGNKKWIPFASDNGDIHLFLDFDPAEGGVPGQVIEVTPESSCWRVLADSYLQFLENYVQALEDRNYTIDEDYSLVLPEEEEAKLYTYNLPEYLKNVEFEKPGANYGKLPPDMDLLQPGSQITIEGEMITRSYPGDEPWRRFDVKLDDKTITFYAGREVTQGYLRIGPQRKAKIEATLNDRSAPMLPEQLSLEKSGESAPLWVVTKCLLIR